MMLDYTNKGHLRAIADALEATAKTNERAAVVAGAIARGFMRPRGLAMHVLCFVARLRDRKNGGFLAIVRALKDPRCEPLLADMWGQTLAWLVDGKDASDHRSAGGFNRNELSEFVGMCMRLGALPHRSQPD